MYKEKWIPALEFCTHYNIDFSFINSLQENGLVEIRTIDEIICFHERQLPDLEKILAFYFDLNINMEGIATVTHLLHRINLLHDEITLLKNRLRVYEGDDEMPGI
jgi:hypothetical protein